MEMYLLVKLETVSQLVMVHLQKANREKYTGYFTDGKMSGMFVVEYADGHVYRGDVDEDATREGKGVYT